MIHSFAERLFFKNILQGLIHNLNTPLNLILGYSQHLQKKFPELDLAPKILAAGMQMDDILQSTYRIVMGILEAETQIIGLNVWLRDELVYLQNDLATKHQCIINMIESENTIKTSVPVNLLCYSIETSVQMFIDQAITRPLNITLQAGVDKQVPIIDIIIQQIDEHIEHILNTTIETLNHTQSLITQISQKRSQYLQFEAKFQDASFGIRIKVVPI